MTANNASQRSKNPAFDQKKANILRSLTAPAGDYHDQSPKGAVDEEIQDLIDQINDIEGCVTTSSCAGRTAVYLEGESQNASTTSRKGSGGRWLFVTHTPLDNPRDDKEASSAQQLTHLFHLDGSKSLSQSSLARPARLVHFKFEPMVRLRSLKLLQRE